MSELTCGHGIYSTDIDCLPCCRFVIDTLNSELGKSRCEASTLREQIAAKDAEIGAACTSLRDSILKLIDEPEFFRIRRAINELPIPNGAALAAEIGAAYEDAKSNFKQLARNVFSIVSTRDLERAIDEWQLAPASARAALAERERLARLEGRKFALLAVVEKLNHVANCYLKGGHSHRAQMLTALCQEILGEPFAGRIAALEAGEKGEGKG